MRCTSMMSQFEYLKSIIDEMHFYLCISLFNIQKNQIATHYEFPCRTGKPQSLGH